MYENPRTTNDVTVLMKHDACPNVRKKFDESQVEREIGTDVCVCKAVKKTGSKQRQKTEEIGTETNPVSKNFRDSCRTSEMQMYKKCSIRLET